MQNLETVALEYFGSRISAPKNFSYQCERPHQFKNEERENNIFSSTIELFHIQLEAFHENENKSFNKGKQIIKNYLGVIYMNTIF